MSEHCVVLFGGTGFVGREIARQYLRRGARLRICVRTPNLGLDLKTQAQAGQLELRRFHLLQADDAEFAAALDGADTVVNAVGILTPARQQSFAAVHAKAPARLAQAVQAKGIDNFVHISALGASEAAAAQYARSKYQGEQAVLRTCPQAMILRPSLILGRGDDFFGRFGQLARWSPVLPLMGGGQTLFQPIAVEDIADMMMQYLHKKAEPKKRKRPRIYEMGGPTQISFKALMEEMLAILGWRRVLLPIPFFLAQAMSWGTQILPGGLKFTPDQLRLLRTHNVLSKPRAKTTVTKTGTTPLAAMIRTSLARFQSQ